jgi:UDP-GlcNAc:undecaprenyl-phosphate GlcNAc-1-phosphate transferase
MAAALAGFLLFNLPPARVYLGDAGSMTIGMALSALALQVATDAAGRSSLTLMVVLLAVPLGDLTLAVIRRSLSGCGICSPDRGHIHHRLLERGFSVPGALGVAATITLISGAIASASRLVGWEPLAWACLIVMAVGLVRSRLAGHIEWAMTKNKFAGGWPRAALPLPTQEQIATLPFDEVWERLVASADRLSLQGVELSLHDAHGAIGTSSNHRLHRWHSAAHAVPATSPSSVEIVMFTIRAETVRLRLEPEGDTAPSGPAWQSLLKAARLAVAHWAESPQSVPAVDTQQTATQLAGEAPVNRWTRAA